MEGDVRNCSTSYMFGMSWCLSVGELQVICNRLVLLSTGEWLLPYWREQTPGAVEDGTCKVHEKAQVEV